MKFFVPRVVGSEEAEQRYEEYERIMSSVYKYRLLHRKIYSVNFVRKGYEHTARVGEYIQTVPVIGELVLAIYETENQFSKYIIVTDRVIFAGANPVEIDQADVLGVEGFDE